MVYDALEQHDRDDHDESDYDDASVTSGSPSPGLASPDLNGSASKNSLGHGENILNAAESASARALSSIVQSITSRTTMTSSVYDMVEDDDYDEPQRISPTPSTPEEHGHVQGSPTDEASGPSSIPQPRPSGPSTLSEPILRSPSGRSLPLQHPTPDLQTLQGAYTGNIEHLEKTAERLSMTSSIDDAIRALQAEQKRNDSRRSSLMSLAEMPPVSRQVSHASSIVETNSLARSGGYSPAGFMMSPKGSFTASGRGRSASKSSRFSSRPEPELEGRTLDSFVNRTSEMSPVVSRQASIAEDQGFPTLTRQVVDLLDNQMGTPEVKEEVERPPTSASGNTLDQAQKMFADFDGVHSAPRQRSMSASVHLDGSGMAQRGEASGGVLSGPASVAGDQQSMSAKERLSMQQPLSYEDPVTGQQMVYYPAPVPMMLNLPQKLSKMPSSMARNKRRAQVLSNLPPGAHQSAIWLPDVLEIENEPNLPEDDEAQQLEYVPQHHRTSVGGRRLTQDIRHVPPQLRANVFFELQGVEQIVDIKEQSAVATLDSILDASAHAPVSAFTDHAFAGHLGAEVYGKPKNSKSSTNLLAPDDKAKKRTSSFNLLRGRRASSSDLLESENEKRRATIADIRSGRIIRDDDEEEEEEEEDGAAEHGIRPDEEEYHGPPTTLLAELQLRKQQQKHRTRPLTAAFPNGLHSTLLELDAVAQHSQKTRKQKRVTLAWEDPSAEEAGNSDDDDEDVPLALLVSKKALGQELNRPLGLLERRELEDNEPLSKRRDRLQGKLKMNRASTMMNLTTPNFGEAATSQVSLGKEGEESGAALPSARPVSGDFATEMMSQFGGDLLDGKNGDAKGKGKESPVPEDEETLGQRRKRLQAEAQARAKEVGQNGGAQSTGSEEHPQKRYSMADVLQAHPAAGSARPPSYTRPPTTGLLGLHEKVSAQRSSTMLNLSSQAFPNSRQSFAPAGGFRNGIYNDGQGGIIPRQPQQRPSTYNPYNAGGAFPQPSLGVGYGAGYGAGFGNPMFANPYAGMGYAAPGYAPGFNGMAMGYMPQMPNAMMGMNMLNFQQPLNQGQIEMVERWRQSVMQ